MAQRTRKDIEMEANRMFGKGASKEKFEWRRAQQAAAGLEQEKKTRGGVAGAYDRNKQLVQAALPVLAGMLVPGIGSGVAGAIAGGLGRGLDRPGKGGIGLDLGSAAKGAISGYGLGQLGGAAGSKLGVAKLGTGGAGTLPPMPAPGAGVEQVGARTASAITPPTTAAGVPLNPMTPPAPAPTPAFAPSAAGQAASRQIAGMGAGMGAGAAGGAGAGAGMAGGAGAAGGAGGAAGGMGTFRQLATNPQVIAGALGGVSNVMGQQAQRRVQEQQLAQQQSQFQQQFDVSEEERKRRQAEANRLASLFMPRA